MKRPLSVIALAGLVFCSTMAGALAAPQDVANDISQHVMSPFCPGVTLHDCPSDNAAQLRAQIATWAADGMTKQQIMDRLVSQYGETIRAEPPTSGTGLLAWLLPGVAVAAGLAIAALIAMRWSRRRPESELQTSAPSALHQRIEAELGELRSKL